MFQSLDYFRVLRNGTEVKDDRVSKMGWHSIKGTYFLQLQEQRNKLAALRGSWHNWQTCKLLKFVNSSQYHLKL